jgi:hypothetical protein
MSMNCVSTSLRYGLPAAMVLAAAALAGCSSGPSADGFMSSAADPWANSQPVARPPVNGANVQQTASRYKAGLPILPPVPQQTANLAPVAAAYQDPAAADPQ